MAAFAQLAVVDHGIYMCLCHSDFCDASSFVLKSEKPQRKRINYSSKHTVKMQLVVRKCLTGTVDLKRVEPPLKATPAQDDCQHRERRK